MGICGVALTLGRMAQTSLPLHHCKACRMKVVVASARKCVAACGKCVICETGLRLKQRSNGQDGHCG